MQRVSQAVVVAILLFPALVMAKGAESSTNRSPEFISACKADFDALELKYRLVRDQLASELSKLSAKISSPELDELKTLNSKMKQAYADFLVTKKTPGDEFKSLSKSFSAAMEKFRNSEKFKAEQARLSKAGFDLWVSSDVYWSLFQMAIDRHAPRAPDLMLRLLDIDTLVDVIAPISSLAEISSSPLGDPHVKALNQTEPECYKVVREKRLDTKSVTNRTEPALSAPPVQSQTSEDSQKSSSSSGAK